ncbi:MAG: diphosphomevalonate decarboxylase, diphosphomevalonate decarboxylase [Candidatus Parcubacteria bacterium]|jgi:diphosphomevalonate decarboxylase
MKTTAIAPSNIAFIKYWGKKDAVLKLPENGSISMNLSNLLTTTTVEFSETYTADSVELNGVREDVVESRAVEHLNRIRSVAHSSLKAKIVTNNNFPTSTGLSSSASGFAALTLAAATAIGLRLSEKELSILARQGSGSACRSIPSGFVEWINGDSSETSYAVSLAGADYWDIADVIAIVNEGKKDVSTTKGMSGAASSPFFNLRLQHMPDKIACFKKALTSKDFTVFGEIIESEALELHAIMLTSHPSLIYWLPGTIQVMRAVKKWRDEGLEVYFTVNTGQDIHLIAQTKDVEKLSIKVREIELVRDIIVNKPSEGARLSNEHLF